MMKKRMILFCLLLAALCLMAAAASAAVSIGGELVAAFQLGLPMDRPETGGYYSRGALYYYAVDGSYTDNVNSTIEWSVIPQNGAPALTISPEGTGRLSTRAWLNLDPNESYVSGSQQYTYQLKMNLNGSITYRFIKAEFVQYALPSGYGVEYAPVSLTDTAAALGTYEALNGAMYNEVGNTYAVRAVFTGESAYTFTTSHEQIDSEWEEIASGSDSRIDNLQLEAGTEVYTARKTGTYHHAYTARFAAHLRASNIACYIPYTVEIAQGTGGMYGSVTPVPNPSPDPDIGGYFNNTPGVGLDQTGTYYVASDLPLDAEEDGVLYSRSILFTYGIKSWSGTMNSETVELDVELISGNVIFRKEKIFNDTFIGALLTEMPAAGTSAEFEASCTVDGQTYTQRVKMDFVQLPSRPTGVEIGYPDPMISAVGQPVDWNPQIWFKNNWEISGQAAYSMYDDGDFLGLLNLDSTTWARSGVHSVPMLATSRNICIRKTIKAVVTEADGTLAKSRYTPFGTVAQVPADLMMIDSQAFAGTRLTEIDIPAGVSIAEDAFDGTGLVAIYCHDQAAIDYAVQHGFVAVVE